MKLRPVVASLFLAACHNGHHTEPPDLSPPIDMAQPADVDGFFQFSTTLGQLMPTVPNQNPIGGTIPNPTVVAVTWDNDQYRTDVEAFYTNYGQSKAWTDQVSEYGIGALTVGAPQHLAGDAPASFSDAELQTMMRTNLGGPSGGAWGKADTSTTYEFFIPPTTTFDEQGENGCCAYYGGYHGDFLIDGVDVTYAVICECDDGAHTLEGTTVTVGHELVETVTDPYYGTPGFEWPDNTYFGWVLVTTGELGDMCEFADTVNWKPSDMNYYVQRTWSNKAAAAGHDPCVGDGTTPYYQAIPYMPDYLDDGFGDKDVLGIKLPVGGTASIGVKVFADADTGPLKVTFQDISKAFGGDALLQFTQPVGTFLPGQVFSVPVKVLKADPQNLGDVQPFQITTHPMNGGPDTFFYGVIGQTAGMPPVPKP